MSPDAGVEITEEERPYLNDIDADFSAFQRLHNYKNVVHLDKVTMLDTVRQMLYDVKAYQAAHKGADPDNYMKVAYWVHWLVKVKPLYLVNGDGPWEEIAKKHKNYYESNLHSVNEHFAVAVALGMLDIKPMQVTKAMQNRLVATLYRGNADRDHLALTFQLLYESVANGKADKKLTKNELAKIIETAQKLKAQLDQ